MEMHGNPTLNKRFLIAIAITLAILFAEIVGGLWTGSLALLADAGHVFLDVFALVLSFAAMRLALRPPTANTPSVFTAFRCSPPLSTAPRCC